MNRFIYNFIRFDKSNKKIVRLYRLKVAEGHITPTFPAHDAEWSDSHRGDPVKGHTAQGVKMAGERVRQGTAMRIQFQLVSNGEEMGGCVVCDISQSKRNHWHSYQCK
ncbi:hypothetical protein XSR1_340047 [Xenorhabdus szentirmaii DSM 16338]|uniref:Uncharacterized protein n=1 Tax=Xenorhabdus szentirmaii DSM 16338 TaxID=1427518 RepID=W1IYU1_9GAMM|nr:hypothetical protein XSR1_340047 [Xenorhabdus szentirmaii DSM 16338]